MLYIIRGLPGSGKSTFANTLAGGLKCPHFEEDMWLYEDGYYIWSQDRYDKAVTQCLEHVRVAFETGEPNVVVSNVFEDSKMLIPYQKLADEIDIPVTYLVAENRRGGVNIHNVPQDALQQMRNDFEVSL
jgi:uridine kinase